MTRLFALLALAGAMLFAAPAQAREDIVLIEMRAQTLLQWVVQKTGYEMPSLPQIVFMDQVDMQRVWDGGRRVSPEGQGEEHSKIRAMYYPGLMLLPPTFRLGDDDWILVHELVHHLQFTSGKLTWKIGACYAAAEVEAYAVQKAWVLENGVGVLPDPIQMFLLAAGCSKE